MSRSFDVDFKYGMESFKTFRFINDDSKISWSKYQIGVAELDVTINTVRKWIEIVSSERYVSDKNKLVGSETYIELDEKEGRALFELLKSVYEDQE